MALKKVKRGDAVALTVRGYGKTYKCVVVSARGGVTGKLLFWNNGSVSDMYFEKQDLQDMRRIKVSDLPKAFAEQTKKWRTAK